jgi:histidine ammonia-lyase
MDLISPVLLLYRGKIHHHGWQSQRLTSVNSYGATASIDDSPAVAARIDDSVQVLKALLTQGDSIYGNCYSLKTYAY